MNSDLEFWVLSPPYAKVLNRSDKNKVAGSSARLGLGAAPAKLVLSINVNRGEASLPSTFLQEDEGLLAFLTGDDMTRTIMNLRFLSIRPGGETLCLFSERIPGQI